MSSIASLGALLTAYVSHIEGAATWVALGICLLLTGTYAFFRTPLSGTGAPGIKTRAFWTSALVIVGSVTAALAETNIADIPPKIVQTASLISAALAAFGYNIWRYKAKTKGGG